MLVQRFGFRLRVAHRRATLRLAHLISLSSPRARFFQAKFLIVALRWPEPPAGTRHSRGEFQSAIGTYRSDGFLRGQPTNHGMHLIVSKHLSNPNGPESVTVVLYRADGPLSRQATALTVLLECV